MGDHPITVWAWRHPRPEGAAGRCIGRTDLAVHPRRAKRLARRIQAAARRHGLPHVVHTSPLRRCADVGRWLRRWGWVHRVDAELFEMNFGRWEGRAWSDIPRAEIDAWCNDFVHRASGGGESLAVMLNRVSGWVPVGTSVGPAIVVAHAGWMLAHRWIADHGGAVPRMDQWPVSPAYGALWRLHESLPLARKRDAQAGNV